MYDEGLWQYSWGALPAVAAGCELKAVASNAWGSVRAASGNVDCLRRTMGGCVATAMTAEMCWGSSSGVSGECALGRGELAGLSAAR